MDLEIGGAYQTKRPSHHYGYPHEMPAGSVCIVKRFICPADIYGSAYGVVFPEAGIESAILSIEVEPCTEPRLTGIPA